MCRRLFVLGQDPPELACQEGVSAEQLAAELGEDLQLMQDLGWGVEGDGETVMLTMPHEALVKTLRRLRRDARRAPCERRHQREPEESDAERWERFRPAVAICEELLGRLDSPIPDEERWSGAAGCPLAAVGRGLTPYTSLSDGLTLAAIAAIAEAALWALLRIATRAE